MPKIKTHSGTKKRFRVTGTGKVMHQTQGRRHLLIGIAALHQNGDFIFAGAFKGPVMRGRDMFDHFERMMRIEFDRELLHCVSVLRLCEFCEIRQRGMGRTCERRIQERRTIWNAARFRSAAMPAA